MIYGLSEGIVYQSSEKVEEAGGNRDVVGSERGGEGGEERTVELTIGQTLRLPSRAS
jgi:hypothetical protein